MATYIAHGDVALSVLMTTASTVGAIFMTPLLTKMLAGALVPVDAAVRRALGRAFHYFCLSTSTSEQGIDKHMAGALVLVNAAVSMARSRFPLRNTCVIF